VDKRTTDPDGRTIVFDRQSHLHLEDRSRHKLLAYVAAILATVSHPDHRELDPWPGRERFYKQHLDERRWMRVVVDFDEEPARVVTAMIQRYDPGSRQ
jgi:hypothetical protein